MDENLTKLGENIFVDGVIGSAIYIVIVVLIMYIMYKLLQKVMAKRQVDNRKSILNIVRGLFSMILTLVTLSRFRMFQGLAQTIIASSGILALVVGVAAQDAIGNLVSGISIISFKPFIVGDLIKMNGEQLIGFVEEITLRHTIIKTYENNRVIVPNSIVNKATIENANLVDSIKGNYFIIPVSYDADVRRAIEIIEEECVNHPKFVDSRTPTDIASHTPAVVVRCVEFGVSALVLRCTLNSRNSFEGFEMLSDLRFSIKERFDEEGIEIPFNHAFIKPKS